MPWESCRSRRHGKQRPENNRNQRPAAETRSRIFEKIASSRARDTYGVPLWPAIAVDLTVTAPCLFIIFYFIFFYIKKKIREINSGIATCKFSSNDEYVNLTSLRRRFRKILDLMNHVIKTSVQKNSGFNESCLD